MFKALVEIKKNLAVSYCDLYKQLFSLSMGEIFWAR